MVSTLTFSGILLKHSVSLTSSWSFFIIFDRANTQYMSRFYLFWTLLSQRFWNTPSYSHCVYHLLCDIFPNKSDVVFPHNQKSQDKNLNTLRMKRAFKTK